MLMPLSLKLKDKYEKNLESRAVFLKLFEVGAHFQFFKKLWAHYTQNLMKCIAKQNVKKKAEKKN